ncbi:unnamed protein product [Gadus morhua 'NCC']
MPRRGDLRPGQNWRFRLREYQPRHAHSPTTAITVPSSHAMPSPASYASAGRAHSRRSPRYEWKRGPLRANRYEAAAVHVTRRNLAAVVAALKAALHMLAPD